MATIQDMMRRLVERLADEPVCDDYITNRLSLSVRTQTNQASRTLAGERGFERRKDACALCGATQVVIRHRGI